MQKGHENTYYEKLIFLDFKNFAQESNSIFFMNFFEVHLYIFISMNVETRSLLKKK